MREYFADEDGVICRDEVRWLHGSRCGLTGSGTGAVDHLARELGKVLLHRVIEIDLTLIDKQHKRRGGDGLGDRGNPE